MKKIAIAVASLAMLAVPMVASAKASTVKPYKLPASYQAVYCYDTGSYWRSQIAAYPDYYAANDAYYRATYGPGTMYCPN